MRSPTSQPKWRGAALLLTVATALALFAVVLTIGPQRIISPELTAEVGQVRLMDDDDSAQQQVQDDEQAQQAEQFAEQEEQQSEQEAEQQNEAAQQQTQLDEQLASQ